MNRKLPKMSQFLEAKSTHQNKLDNRSTVCFYSTVMQSWGKSCPDLRGLRRRGTGIPKERGGGGRAGAGLKGCDIDLNQNPKLVKTKVLLYSRMDSSLPSSSNQTSGVTFSFTPHFHLPPGWFKSIFLFQLPPYWFQLPTPNLSVLWYIAQNVADKLQIL